MNITVQERVRKDAEMMREVGNGGNWSEARAGEAQDIVVKTWRQGDMQAGRHEMHVERCRNIARVRRLGVAQHLLGRKNEANNRSRQKNVLHRCRLIARRRSQAYQLSASVPLGDPA